jgi:hypothetical protein
MAKKVKCEVCGMEFEEGKTHELHPEKAHEHSGKVYVHDGKVVCESCLIDAGVPLDQAEPQGTYIRLHTDMHRDGMTL